jgi:hypothetical protein
MFSHSPLAMINQRIDRGLAHILINPAVRAVDQSEISSRSKLNRSFHPSRDRIHEDAWAMTTTGMAQQCFAHGEGKKLVCLPHQREDYRP